MKYLFAILASVFVFATAPSTEAWQIQKGASYAGPGDVQAFTAWYGLRAYSRSVAASGTGKMLRIRNTSSNELCDVLIVTNGGMGLTANCTSTGAGQSVSSFCGGVDCGVQTFYDQVQGNACSAATCNLVQNTNANQPLLRATDSYLSIRMTANTMGVASANNFTPSAAKQTLMAVANRDSGTVFANLINSFGSNNRINTSGTGADTWQVVGGASGSANVTATATNWHAIVGIINGAGVSGGCVDAGCSPTGTTTGSTTAAAPFSFGASTAVREREIGVIDNFAANSTVNGNLISNAKTYWGF